MLPVDVVIPVYDGYRETVACLQSVLATVDPAWARLVVINDCSPDPGITAWLRELAAETPGLVLLENEQNLGFVATANRGMSYDDSRDILLLNSDVEVANDWLHRLRTAAYRQAAMGSLTPYANNATICSFPNFCKDNELLFGLTLAELDAYFAEQFTADDIFQVPTGVGCCMFIRRQCLAEVGYFDVATFGKGYGEENDWCQRALKAGWQNGHLANCFVYHKGGVSFAGEQSPRIARALELLDQRYPRYHRDVQEYIAADVARGSRTGAILGLFARQTKPKILFISHKLGGGAQQHIDELAALYSQQALDSPQALFAMITPEREGESVSLSFFDGGSRLQDGLFFEVDSQYDQLVELLRELGIGRVHFHHTMGVPTRLWRLAADLNCSYDLTIHDYYLVNGNPTLTDVNAGYVSVDRDDFDLQCAGHYPLPAGVDAVGWRENQQVLVQSADRLLFPSADCRRRFQQFYPGGNCVTSWHPDYVASQPYPQPRWVFPADRPLRVLVLGALSREKGADVLEAVALALAPREIEFHLLGYAYRALDRSIIAHGPYDNSRVHTLIAQIKPDVAWFPARWPETYSYTLSIALHNALPVVVPDIGAFGERVQQRDLSIVRPWDSSTEQWCEFWLEVLQRGALPLAVNSAAPVALDQQFYESAYLQPVAARRGELTAATLESLMDHLHAHSRELSRSERLLARMWRLSNRPLVARLVALVPFRMQQALKRRLSHRPLHDIVRK